MISYSISKQTVSKHGEITSVLATMPISEDKKIEMEFISFGAGIRRISYIDEKSNVNKLLTLSYEDVLESCQNPSLAGLTIGPNAGRLEANKSLTFKDKGRLLSVNLPANEDNTKQIHGGKHNLSSQNWIFEGVNNPDDNSLSIRFSYSQENDLDEWPGNRIYEVKYTISDDGFLTIALNGFSDMDSYINLTNHTYWLRDSLSLEIFAENFIKNHEDFLPKELCHLEGANPYTVEDSSILNNAFILSDRDNVAAKLSYENIPLEIDMTTDAPALVVYTGDYLDNKAKLFNEDFSKPACAIALEAQEMYPLTDTTITSVDVNFHRVIKYHFKALSAV